MKAEINNENKAKFFALYWGQEVGWWNKVIRGNIVNEVRKVKNYFIDFDPNYSPQLLLKPLSEISDEEAVEVARIVFPRINDWKFSDRKQGNVWIDDNEDQDLGVLFTKNLFEINGDKFNMVDEFKRIIQAADYLRSRGYALPWMGISVEEQIEAGWVKLMEG